MRGPNQSLNLRVKKNIRNKDKVRIFNKIIMNLQEQIIGTTNSCSPCLAGTDC